MGSQTLMRIPTIDFLKEDLFPGTETWVSVQTEACKALEEYGCFEAVCTKIPTELLNATFGAIKELFDLPLEIKMKNASDKPYYGYVPINPTESLYESLGISEAPIVERVQDFTKTMWPEGNETFCGLVHSFAVRMDSIMKMTMRMVFERYGLEKYHDSHMDSVTNLLRVMKYRVPEVNETKLGVPCHTDKSLLSILHQNQVNGLEILTKNGEWISVTPTTNSFVVMIGDAFMGWSNGRLHSPKHRVLMDSGDTRYTTGLFTFSKEMIHVPNELIDDEHPLMFKPFHNFGLLDFYITPEGLQAESTLKAYCGI